MRRSSGSASSSNGFGGFPNERMRSPAGARDLARAAVLRRPARHPHLTGVPALAACHRDAAPGARRHRRAGTLRACDPHPIDGLTASDGVDDGAPRRARSGPRRPGRSQQGKALRRAEPAARISEVLGRGGRIARGAVRPASGRVASDAAPELRGAAAAPGRARLPARRPVPRPAISVAAQIWVSVRSLGGRPGDAVALRRSPGQRGTGALPVEGGRAAHAAGLAHGARALACRLGRGRALLGSQRVPNLTRRVLRHRLRQPGPAGRRRRPRASRGTRPAPARPVARA